MSIQTTLVGRVVKDELVKQKRNDVRGGGGGGGNIMTLIFLDKPPKSHDTRVTTY